MDATACPTCCALIVPDCAEHHAAWHRTLTHLPTEEHPDDH